MLHGLQAAGKTAPDDAPILFSDIASAMSLADAMWCCRAEPQHAAIWRRYAVWCARQVQHLMADPRSLAALDVAERHAAGQATDEELAAARISARTAARTAWAAISVTPDAAWAAIAATSTTWAATWAAARDAWAAASDAARDAADAAAEATKLRAFIQICTDGTLPGEVEL